MYICAIYTVAISSESGVFICHKLSNVRYEHVVHEDPEPTAMCYLSCHNATVTMEARIYHISA
jgi:hypothetical protein